MRTQQEVAEHVRDWLALAFCDLADDMRHRGCRLETRDYNAAVLEGISRFVADAVLAGTRPEGPAQAYVADYLCRRIVSQVEIGVARVAS